MREELISLKAQLRAGAIGVGLVAISICGMTTKFIPAETYALYAQYLSVTLTLVFCIFFYYAFFKRNSKVRDDLFETFGKLPAAGIMLITPMGLFLVLLLALTWGLPSIAHAFVGEEAEESFKVYPPDHAYLNTLASCKGQLTVESNLLFKSHICFVPEAIYNSVSGGDTILIKGKKSLLGFSYYHVGELYFGDMDAKFKLQKGA